MHYFVLFVLMSAASANEQSTLQSPEAITVPHQII